MEFKRNTDRNVDELKQEYADYGYNKGIETGVAASKDAWLVCNIAWALIGYIVYLCWDYIAPRPILAGIIIIAYLYSMLTVPDKAIKHYIEKRR